MIAYNDPYHSYPHGQFPARVFGKHERDDASCEAPQVVDGDNDTFEGWAGVIEGVEKVGIADNSREDTLVVAEEYECKLTRDCDGGSKAKAPSKPVEIRCSDHGGGGCRYAVQA